MCAQLMDQQLDTMLLHTGRYSSLLAKRLQGQGAGGSLPEAVPSQQPSADQASKPSAAHPDEGGGYR